MKEIIEGEPVLFFRREEDGWKAYGTYVERFMYEITGRYPGVRGDYREVEVGEGRMAMLTFTPRELELLLEAIPHARITDSLVAVAV